MALAKLRVGDNVKVIAGRSKNAVGKIIQIDGDHIYVGGVNLVVKSVKKRQGEEQQAHQGFKKIEAPIHRSNVVYFDQLTQKPLKIAIKEIDGKRQRVNRKTGELLSVVEVV